LSIELLDIPPELPPLIENKWPDIDHFNSCLISSRPKGGFFSFGVNENGAKLRTVFGDEQSEEIRQAKRAEALKAHRLVKAAKCPTVGKVHEYQGQTISENQIKQQEKMRFFCESGNRELFDQAAIAANYKKNDTGILWELYRLQKTGEKSQPIEIDKIPEPRKITCTGSKAIIEHRAWCDEYRIRTKTELANSSTPPEQSGKRKTKQLSLSGAKAISDSCYFVASDKTRGGFSTFLTLTLDDAARKRVASDETTVQREISRFFDAIQKTYQRGWVHTFENKNRAECKKGASQQGVEYRGEGNKDKLDYVWVVENPKNEDGEDNPHAHIMMRWRVPFSHFGAWAERLESIWGQGFATLEKIKEPEKAGSYIAKAAGYMTKGSGSDQGEVRGNRYGMSKTARAPAWEVYGIYENGIMGSLVSDVYDHFMCEHGTKIQKRNFLKEKLDALPKSETNKKERAKIGAALETIRGQLNSNEVPHRPSKYQLVIKGQVHFKDFILWAQDQLHIQSTPKWLPAITGVPWRGNDKPDGPWFAEYKKRIFEGRVWRWFSQSKRCFKKLESAAAEYFSEFEDEDLSIEDFKLA
jgi:hypothetical protein